MRRFHIAARVARTRIWQSILEAWALWFNIITDSSDSSSLPHPRSGTMIIFPPCPKRGPKLLSSCRYPWQPIIFQARSILLLHTSRIPVQWWICSQRYFSNSSIGREDKRKLFWCASEARIFWKPCDIPRMLKVSSRWIWQSSDIFKFD